MTNPCQTTVFHPACRRTLRTIRPALTLVELLSAIGVLGILAVIVIPVVGNVRQKANGIKEVASARYLTQAYLLASNDANNGTLIPGRAYYNSTTGEGVVTGGYDETGTPLTPYQASVWTHRVRPYLGDRFFSTLFMNKQEDYWRRIASGGNYDVLARYYTTFGINERYIGGGSFYRFELDMPISRIDEAIDPSGLIVFVSATNHAPAPSLYEHAGFWRVDAPEGGSWVNEGGSGGPSNDEEALSPQYGFIAYRYNLKAVVAFLDGHVEMKGYDEMKDMRLWSNLARKENNRAYTPGYLE